MRQWLEPANAVYVHRVTYILPSDILAPFRENEAVHFDRFLQGNVTTTGRERLRAIAGNNVSANNTKRMEQ